VTSGLRMRDVYLPGGTWSDERTGETMKGPVWLRNYDAPLDVVPTFRRVTV